MRQGDLHYLGLLSGCFELVLRVRETLSLSLEVTVLRVWLRKNGDGVRGTTLSTYEIRQEHVASHLAFARVMCRLRPRARRHQHVVDLTHGNKKHDLDDRDSKEVVCS